ncbi:hypothetical protein PFICI_00802 [Pestalotiopsis fici W106-1]|uniref:Uncharacterized protein n=1 Tax=Pestalotiopsis fici (strain W106-1 / CGMCC3.15140) TaxID=1229662 RepID=W3XLU9_PESFW|nr:uncharacterized protein PFICI_00802 [Pestalotiopsis fici W106-1]ETS86974.1 hypothetical protein PFICI_00802 [Pestalotiopsis fici W106-1]
MLTIANLRIQSQETSFSDWISVSTLGLAPLVAHILAGAPQPSFLVSSKPRWHDRICVLNPTTILCRYAAIVDRRIRARGGRWEPGDAAAANAIFWTCQGWVGSDLMAVEALPLCTLLPECGTVRLLSTEMLKTIIVTLQGLQSLVMLLGGATGTIMYNQYFGLDWVFGPLSIMGLLRLFAAPWLTSDFMYSIRTAGTGSAAPDRSRHSVDSLCITSEEKSPVVIRYRSSSYRPSRCFRVLYLGLLASCWLLAVWWTFIKPFIQPTGLPLTLSAFITGAFYVSALASVIAIFFYYYVWHGSTSTVLPCIGETWYKVYTMLLMSFTLVVILLVALETYKTPCGTYSSLPRKCADLVCKVREGEVTGAFTDCY